MPSARTASSSDSTATVKVSSPLNPSTGATDTPPHAPPTPLRKRGHSISTLRELAPGSSSSERSSAGGALAGMTSTPLSNSPSLTVRDDFDDLPSSSFRSRSRSPGRFDGEGLHQSPAHRNASPSRWWNNLEHSSRPWRDPPKRKKTVPAEQTEGWVHTRERVAQAAASVLGTAGDIAHEALFMSVELLDFAPIPGLQAVAKTLLNIWDALQMVDMSRLACLRLTERCAEILISIRQEVKEAGDTVGQELAAPVSKLHESFHQVYIFLQKQAHRPFLKRYLKRDEILRDISGCDASLAGALELFGISIQIRILKQVQASEARRQADTQALLNSINNSRQPQNALLLTGLFEEPTELPSSSSHPSLSPSDSPTAYAHAYAPPPYPPGSPNLPPAEILPALRTLHTMQNSVDAARDSMDLRQLMRAALETSSDVEMLAVLQIRREELPEAIKTLQRALERVVERDGIVKDDTDAAAGQGNLARRVSIKRIEGGAGPDLNRSMTIVSVESGGSSGSEERARDTLDREFIETGIDVLRRMSNGVEASLPSWTITRYEVDRESKIGVGFFSDVYKGKWRGRTVAIKVLAESTPRKLFIREISIWKTLQHPNVLQLYGASSASGDPPWFFVSPYEKNGSLTEYLRRVAMDMGADPAGVGLGMAPRLRTASFPVLQRSLGNGSPWSPGLGVGGEVPKEWNLYRFMHEIAKGMEYLHSQGVLHGDLKAANVLVDDGFRCVISDFGLSEMKSEAYRISGRPPQHGTLRWQAPELMSGQSQLTTEMDVYAFAILCIEILTMGRVPWPLMDDDAVRFIVLKENQRPQLPFNRFSTPALHDLLQMCWHRDPSMRPAFSSIVPVLKQMRKTIDQNTDDTSTPQLPVLPEFEEHPPRPSPDMRPMPLPTTGTPPRDIAAGILAGSSPGMSDNASYRTAREVSQSPPTLSQISYREDTVSTSRVTMPEPVFYTPSAPSSRASSIFTHTPASQSEDNIHLVNYEGYDSPPPLDERIAQTKNERRYRMLLNHEFHPSLTLPLWDPTPVALGAVGYLSKPSGAFVTLFDSFNPEKSSGALLKGMPSLHGYGRVTSGSQRQDKRSAAQRGLDAFVGLLTFGGKGDGSISVGRRYSFPLRTGHKTAYLCTETTAYQYIESLDPPKRWFKANVDAIMERYGAQHRIQKEDLYLVIGKLDTPDYGLFVSHTHPDGQAHFNVFSAPRAGQPWGTFTTDTEYPAELGGPVYHESVSGNPSSASKVSNNGGPWNTVLIARLRFKPDVLEPTSL